MERITCDPKFPEVTKTFKDTLAQGAKELWEGMQQETPQGDRVQPYVVPAELNCRSCIHRSVGCAHLFSNLLQNEGGRKSRAVR